MSSQCLACACENPENAAAAALLSETDSLTNVGIAAAVFIASSPEHERIVTLARNAIEEQREWCRQCGPFRPDECLLWPRAVPDSGRS